MALNEAAVQLMSSKISGEKVDTVKYFDITLPTTSPSYYTLECNLVNQMAYITGDYTLYNSTLFSNDNFKSRFIELTSEKTFYKIQNNLDSLIGLEDALSLEVSKLGSNDLPLKTINKIESEIDYLRKQITNLFINTQNLILTSYFNKSFKSIMNLEQIENYRRELYNYKDVIGTTKNYTFFNDYYISKMAELEKKRYAFEGSETLALAPVKRGLISTLFSKIKKLFTSTEIYEKEM